MLDIFTFPSIYFHPFNILFYMDCMDRSTWTTSRRSLTSGFWSISQWEEPTRFERERRMESGYLLPSCFSSLPHHHKLAAFLPTGYPPVRSFICTAHLSRSGAHSLSFSFRVRRCNGSLLLLSQGTTLLLLNGGTKIIVSCPLVKCFIDYSIFICLPFMKGLWLLH